MKEYIILTVPIGSIVRSGDGSTFILNEVPNNALDLIEKGATYLIFKNEAKEPLKKLSAERLQAIIEMRKNQKLNHDVSILELALAEKVTGKVKDPPEVITEKQNNK